MAENRNQENRGIGQQPQYQQGNKPDFGKSESASKPGKPWDRERDRASEADKARQDQARRNPGNIQTNPNKDSQR